MEAIRTSKLTKVYKDLTAVDELDLTIEEGELFSLLGVNGAGKTTTIKMLSCLTAPTSGNAWLLGNSIITDSKRVKELIALSPQETAVAMKLTVRENMRLLCGIYGLNKEQTQSKITELVDKFNLRSILDKRASKLSGGWQRRLSIALSLISEPKILFLDEPTLGLDVIARQELWDIIRELKGKVTIILTTHYMEEAESLSDRLCFMKDGKIIMLGTPDEVKERTETSSIEEAFIKTIKEAKL